MVTGVDLLAYKINISLTERDSNVFFIARKQEDRIIRKKRKKPKKIIPRLLNVTLILWVGSKRTANK